MSAKTSATLGVVMILLRAALPNPDRRAQPVFHARQTAVPTFRASGPTALLRCCCAQRSSPTRNSSLHRKPPNSNGLPPPRLLQGEPRYIYSGSPFGRRGRPHVTHCRSAQWEVSSASTA